MTTTNAKGKLLSDLKNKCFSTLYILYGEETYLKEYYLGQLKKYAVEDTFRDFNLMEFEGKNLTLDALQEAIDSYPAMAEHKLIVVSDMDLCKLPADTAESMLKILSDLPDYLTLVFYYDLLDGKMDKRTKIYKTLEKTAVMVELNHLEGKELNAWIIRRFHALDCEITDEVCEYLIFLCGNSMSSLIGEIEKAAAFCTTGKITKYHIDAVCSPVMEAVVFDLSDAISAGNFSKAISLVDQLIRQKNNEVMLYTTITRHIQRLYGAKLCEGRGEGSLMKVLGSSSPYYAKRISREARKMSLPWLRRAASICAQTDTLLKGSAADKQKLIELSLLKMANGEEGAI